MPTVATTQIVLFSSGCRKAAGLVLMVVARECCTGVEGGVNGGRPDSAARRGTVAEGRGIGAMAGTTRQVARDMR